MSTPLETGSQPLQFRRAARPYLLSCERVDKDAPQAQHDMGTLRNQVQGLREAVEDFYGLLERFTEAAQAQMTTLDPSHPSFKFLQSWTAEFETMISIENNDKPESQSEPVSILALTFCLANKESSLHRSSKLLALSSTHKPPRCQLGLPYGQPSKIRS